MRLVDADYLVNVMIPNRPIEEGGIPVQDFATHNRILAFYPTIDAVPVVHGRWVVYTDEDEYSFSEYFRCSICGATHYNDDNYCPNCGAKMDGEADG